MCSRTGRRGRVKTGSGLDEGLYDYYLSLLLLFLYVFLLSSSLLSKNLKIKIYRSINLPVVLYGCGTWSLTLREERRLRVFENRVLRKIFVAKRDEVTGVAEHFDTVFH
jgi:hypothetical protein